MLQKILLPVILAVLTYGFWLSPDFKEIAAGVAIFLFGMLFLEQGFNTFTGGLLERLLRQTTDRLWKSIGFGVVSTTVMQSSSLVSVITISFLSAGLLELPAGVGIIFGANIGTTTGAWLIAGFGLKVKISAYAMPMLVFGIVLAFQKSKTLKGIGYVLAGLGFLFLGIYHMKEGFEAFKDSIDLVEYAMPGLKGLLMFTLIGVAATVIMQSSHATLVLIITALAAQQITYENALALAIGANVGTTITAIIGSLSANYQGKRLAAAHLIFNTVTGAIAIVFISQLVLIVNSISASVGIPDDDYTLKLAVFHSVFNVIGVTVMAPVLGLMVAFLEKVIPTPAAVYAQPTYLNDAVLDFPETLLEAVRNEVAHLLSNAIDLMLKGLHLDKNIVLASDDLERDIPKQQMPIEFDYDAEYESQVKPLYSDIVAFISRARSAVPSEQANQLFELRATCNKIGESVKGIKHLRKNMTRYIRSDNKLIRDEYNNMRIRLGGLMKELTELQADTEPDNANLLAINAYKVDLEQNNIIADGRIDHYIRTNAIKPIMATSLMNDKVYEQETISSLIDTGSVLFAARDPDVREVEQMISLDEDEMTTLAKASETS